MFRTLARLFLLRFLPQRLIPLLTIYEIYRFVRNLQTRRQRPVQPHGPYGLTGTSRTELLESGDDLAASPRALDRGSRQAGA